MFKPTLTSSITKTIPVPESEASVTIHYIKPGIMDNINQESMQLTSQEEDGKAGMKAKIAFNMSAKDRNIVRECLDSWSGFTTDEGKVMKFGPVNLEKMIVESTEFVSWVVEQHDKLAEEVEGQEEEAEKN